MDIDLSYLAKLLSPTQAAALSPGALAHYSTNGHWKWAKHLQIVNTHLIRVAQREITRLIVKCPPRHGKSMLISHHFPAWWLGTFPDQRIILVSHSDEAAQEWGRKSRDVMREHGQAIWGDISVRGDSGAASRWDLEGRTGGLIASGIGGLITGKGADLLVIDDYIRNPQDAMSPAIKRRQWDWYTGTARFRLQPNGAIIIMATPWAVDDLIGELEQRSNDGTGEKFTVLSFPAECDDPATDLLGRKEGEALWPEQFPLEALEAIKKGSTPFWFNAEYQCRPSLPEGNQFKRSMFSNRFVLDRAGSLLQSIVTLDRAGANWPLWRAHRFIVVDPAASEKETADYTAMGVFAVTPANDLLILDMVRERIDIEAIVPRLKRLVAHWEPEFVAFEDTGFQKALVREARRSGNMVAVREVKPEGKGKLARAHRALYRGEAGQLFLLAGAKWIDAFIEECVTFTGMDDKHDDMVDVLSYACLLMDKRLGVVELVVDMDEGLDVPYVSHGRSSMYYQPADRFGRG